MRKSNSELHLEIYFTTSYIRFSQRSVFTPKNIQLCAKEIIYFVQTDLPNQFYIDSFW